MIRTVTAFEWIMDRPTAMAAAVLLLLGVAAVAPAQQADEASARGRAVFFAQGCHGCHTMGEVGTPIAADLSRIGERYSRAGLERWLRDPAAEKPGAHMPKLTLTEDEIRVLAEVLTTPR